MERPRGAWIRKVYRSSPADKAGMRDGDVVLRFAGIDITDLNHLINMVSMAAVGEPAEVVVWRDRREHKLLVTVGDRDRTLTSIDGLRRTWRLTRPGCCADPTARAPARALFWGSSWPRSTPSLQSDSKSPNLAWRPRPECRQTDPLARLVMPTDVISSIDNEVIQSAEQAVKILNQRADHVQLNMSLDRLKNGKMEQHTVRVP